MKQKVKPVKKTAKQKKPSQYTIEMDARGIGFFLTLGLGVALIVFYLGYTAGKATRNPNALAVQQPALDQGDKEAAAGDVQKNLKIYDIREESGSKIAALKKSSEETLSDADRLIEESKREAEAKPAATEKPKSKTPPAKKADDFKPQWPDKAETKKNGSTLYTYQIMSTPDIERASSRVKLLKQRGFDAYRVAAKVKGKLYYRVRVGRGSKSDLKSLEPKLRKVLSGDGQLLLMRYGQ